MTAAGLLPQPTPAPPDDVSPSGSGAARPGLRGTRGQIAGVGVGQLVAAEIAAVLVLGGFALGAGWLVAGIVVAAIMLALAFGRVGGSWLYRVAAQRWRLAIAQPRRSPATRSTDPRLTALSELAPALDVRDFPDRHTRLGIAADGAGWYAAIAVAVPPGLRGSSHGQLPLAELATAVADAGVRGARLQLVTQVVPAPSSTLAGSSPAMQSYEQLPGARTGTIPMHRHSWLAVRLELADALAAAEPRGGGTAGVGRAIAALVGRIGKTLTTANVDYQVLDGNELVDAVTRCCHLTGSPTGPDRRTTESWDRFAADDTETCTLVVTSWPARRGGDPSLLSQLVRVRGASVTVSLAISHPTDGRAGVRALVQVAGTGDALPEAVRTVRAIAQNAGARIRPAYGRQAAAAYATAPTGGGVR